MKQRIIVTLKPHNATEPFFGELYEVNRAAGGGAGQPINQSITPTPNPTPKDYY